MSLGYYKFRTWATDQNDNTNQNWFIAGDVERDIYFCNLSQFSVASQFASRYALADQLWDGEIMPIEPVIDNKAKGTFAQREALLRFIHEDMIG